MIFRNIFSIKRRFNILIWILVFCFIFNYKNSEEIYYNSKYYNLEIKINIMNFKINKLQLLTLSIYNVYKKNNIMINPQ